MEEVLRSIIKPDASAREYIDKQLLQKHTSAVKATSIKWSGVRHLHLLGDTDGIVGASPNEAYVDVSKEWVMITGVSPEEIRKYLSRCKPTLEVLTLFSTGITQLDVRKLTGLKTLVLKDNAELTELQGIEFVQKLEMLDIEKSRVSCVAFTKRMPELRCLMLNRNHRLAEIQGLDNLPALEKLHLSFSGIDFLYIHALLLELRDFEAAFTPLRNISFLSWLPNVQRVDLQGTFVTDLSVLSSLTDLRTLVLTFTPVSSLEGVALPQSLERLYLDNTKVRRLPDTIGKLPKLHRLNLSGLWLEALPEWLPNLNLGMGRESGYDISMKDTVIDGVDMRIFDQSQDIIRAWFKNRKLDDSPRPLNELKVVFLGDGGAGKSRTIARLLLDGEQTEKFPNISTPGIVIQDKTYTIGDRDIVVHFWDFGGQDILHSMHRMFLTERTLYVVMLNVRDGTQTERGRYWLHNLKSFAKGAPVLIVLNQIDTNRNAQVNQTDLKAMYPGLTEVISMSALEDDAETVEKNLIAALKRQICAFPTLTSSFLPAWNRLKEQLHTMSDYYIKGDQFHTLCEICGVEEDQSTRMSLLRWFSDLGISFHYGNSRKLKDYVILRPDWITNAIYTIIFNKSEQVTNGLISHEAIYGLLNPKPEDKDKIRSAIPGMVYQPEEVDYVLDVVRKFRLSFRVSEETEFIPMLCQANSPDVAAEYEHDPHTLEFRMEYEYLPNNVLHRLMVDMRRDLVKEQVWLTGALFRQESNGLSAVVKTEGDLLRIFVRGENDNHRPQTYLNIIRAALKVIHDEMGLTEPKALIVYKKASKTASFLYDDLLGALECGLQHTYSSDLGGRVLIRDILDQSDRDVERRKRKLLADVAGACLRMQDKKIMWKATEDDRNTELRDALLNMGYRVADQSFSGVGSGQKRAGELDLRLLSEDNLPWTVCEALNIKGTGTTQEKNWDKHLSKLLINYNPVGMQDLILISYVEASAEQFVEYWNYYDEHMRWYNPPGVIRREGSYQAFLPLDEEYSCLRTVRCIYDRGGMPTTVYHYFLRIGI